MCVGRSVKQEENIYNSRNISQKMPQRKQMQTLMAVCWTLCQNETEHVALNHIPVEVQLECNLTLDTHFVYM